MSDLLKHSLLSAKQGLQNGDFSASELVAAHLEAMQENAHLNAFITPTPEQATAAAAKADLSKPMGGLPIGMKDLFCTKNVPTTAGSKMLEKFVPPYESTVSQQLKDAGAITLGKLNLDEFAMGSANITSYYGNVLNPLKANDDTELCRVPGGSSGGSAAAVAANLCLAATGTDTGGSIRQPAAFTGIVGLKPTYGRCSRWGIVAFASSLDQAGTMTKTVDDAAFMLQHMTGHDAKDSTSATVSVPDYSALLDKGVQGMKIGIPKEYQVDGMEPSVIKSWKEGEQALKDAGAELVEISLPHTAYALPCYYIIAPAEASSNLARYDGVRYTHRSEEGENLIDLYEHTRAEGFGREVKKRIMIGTYVLSAGYYDAYYLQAQKVRSLIARDFTEAFTKVDAILAPTTPDAAFKLGEKQDDPVKMYLNDVLTVPASLAGLPAISVPFGKADNGLPLGLQVIGKAYDEQTVLQVAKVLHK